MKIFQEKSGKLNELQIKIKNGENFDNEKAIQGLIENNLGIIFTDLEFIKTEHQIDDLRIDTIAFDKNRNSFVIIEYKNKKDEDVLAQGISYYQLLQNKKAEFVLLYNKIKNAHFETREINWDDTRIIFIALTFTKYQKMASGFAGLPTEFYIIKKYENDVTTLDRIDIKSEDSIATGETKPKTKSRDIIGVYTEEEYLAGEYETTPASEQTKALWYELKNSILETFSKLEFRQKKKYGGFYSKDDNACVCTIDATKSFIWLCYSTTQEKYYDDPFVEYTPQGHFGVGDYRSKIQNISDGKKALQFIQKVYSAKVKSDSNMFDQQIFDGRIF